MVGSVIRVDDRDLRRLGGRADDLDNLRDTAPLMREISAAMEAWTVGRFEREVAPDGAPWQPSRRALEEGGQTLTDRGLLRQSISRASTPRTAEAGTNLIYGGVHQEGAVIRPVNARALIFQVGGQTVSAQEVTIPARPYLGIGDDDERELGAIVGDFLNSGIGA